MTLANVTALPALLYYGPMTNFPRHGRTRCREKVTRRLPSARLCHALKCPLKQASINKPGWLKSKRLISSDGINLTFRLCCMRPFRGEKPPSAGAELQPRARGAPPLTAGARQRALKRAASVKARTCDGSAGEESRKHG